jgi:drug/metabolite transporter (DMT)-like permease
MALMIEERPTVIMVFVVVLIDKPWMLTLPSQDTVWSLVALAVFGTALAYIVFFKILARAGGSNVMLVTLLIPVTALILGNVFLGESIQSKETIGAIIIGSGLLFIDGRLINRLTGKHAAAD